MLNSCHDHVIEQNWQAYRPAEHRMWRRLAARQRRLLPGRAWLDFLANLDALSILDGGIPHFDRLNEILGKATGWRIVAVPGALPEAFFLRHLANRRFPVARFIRGPEQMDDACEPDVFHGIFGHVPLLMNPLFADYMQAYGEAGMKAPGALKHLRRLYRSTVECGLIETDIGLRIYGAGILCCGGEVEFSLESPSPNRIRFDLNRVLRTRRHNGDYQASYFVISDFRDLYEPARRGFAPILRALEGAPDIASGALLPQDELLN